MAEKTVSLAPRELRLVDPAGLIVGENVRTHVELKESFLESIRQRGILQSPLCVERDGDLHVVIGQRRTLAAVRLGLERIHVEVTDEATASAAERAERVASQISENEHRQGLTDAELAAGYQQMALFGLPAGEIAKRVGDVPERVEAALRVQASPRAAQVLREPQVTLEQAAVIADAPDEAVDELAQAAAGGARVADLQARAERLAEEANRRREVVALEESVTAQGFRLVTPSGGSGVAFESYQGVPSSDLPEGVTVRDLSNLALAESPEVEASPDDVRQLGSLVIGRVSSRDWSDPSLVVRYMVLSPAEHGLVERVAPSPVLSESEIAALEQAKAEREAAEERRRQRAAADVARREFMAQVLQRKKLPNDWHRLVAFSMMAGDLQMQVSTVLDAAADVVGVSTGYDAESEPWLDAINHMKSSRLLLLAAFDVLDALASGTSWNLEDQPRELIEFLTVLERWGYELTGFEKELREVAQTALAAALEGEEGDDNE